MSLDGRDILLRKCNGAWKIIKPTKYIYSRTLIMKKVQFSEELEAEYSHYFKIKHDEMSTA